MHADGGISIAKQPPRLAEVGDVGDMGATSSMIRTASARITGFGSPAASESTAPRRLGVDRCHQTRRLQTDGAVAVVQKGSDRRHPGPGCRQTLPPPSAAGPAPRSAASCPQTPARPHPPSARARQPRIERTIGIAVLHAVSAASDVASSALRRPSAAAAAARDGTGRLRQHRPPAAASSQVRQLPSASATICGSSGSGGNDRLRADFSAAASPSFARAAASAELIGELALARRCGCGYPASRSARRACGEGRRRRSWQVCSRIARATGSSSPASSSLCEREPRLVGVETLASDRPPRALRCEARSRRDSRARGPGSARPRAPLRRVVRSRARSIRERGVVASDGGAATAAAARSRTCAPGADTARSTRTNAREK